MPMTLMTITVLIHTNEEYSLYSFLPGGSLANKAIYFIFLCSKIYTWIQLNIIYYTYLFSLGLMGVRYKNIMPI